MNYKDSGVDREAGRSFVDQIKKVAPAIGGFNGMMKVPSKYKKPVLVSGTDGVGTKLHLAHLFGGHKGVGMDLVAMCANDVITCGANPLYFLDYIACGKLDPKVLGEVVDGILEGCKQCGMELLGGETAEMPRLYGSDKYDLAGFCTGIVEEDKIIDGSKIQPGDLIVGIESSGLHSNGYSLINKLLLHQKIYYKEMPELSTPTIIYAPLIMQLLRRKRPIHGMAHITGGGIPENLPRCIPDGLGLEIDYNSWERPEIFDKIAKAGDISEEEMRNTFNMGIGLCLVVPPDSYVDTGIKIWGNDLQSWIIGKVVVQS